MTEFVKNFINNLTPDEIVAFKAITMSVSVAAIYIFVKFIEKISLGAPEDEQETEE